MSQEKELIVWRNDYSTGNKLVDEQHRILISHINNLYAAFLKGKANEMIGELTENLVQYTLFHFESEEQLFAEIEEQKRNKHLEKHKYFSEKIKDFQRAYKNSAENLSYEIMTFLRDWLQDHILFTDKNTFKEL